MQVLFGGIKQLTPVRQRNMPLNPLIGVPLIATIQILMNQTIAALQVLYDRIPRRHSVENVIEINSILTEYEDLLIRIEAINTWYEKNIPNFFEELDSVRSGIKKSTDNKASKKNKDNFFDEASGILKDSIQALMEVYGDGTRTS